jgi:hypothetical protein
LNVEFLTLNCCTRGKGERPAEPEIRNSKSKPGATRTKPQGGIEAAPGKSKFETNSNEWKLQNWRNKDRKIGMAAETLMAGSKALASCEIFSGKKDSELLQ